MGLLTALYLFIKQQYYNDMFLFRKQKSTKEEGLFSGRFPGFWIFPNDFKRDEFLWC